MKRGNELEFLSQGFTVANVGASRIWLRPGHPVPFPQEMARGDGIRARLNVIGS